MNMHELKALTMVLKTSPSALYTLQVFICEIRQIYCFE